MYMGRMYKDSIMSSINFIEEVLRVINHTHQETGFVHLVLLVDHSASTSYVPVRLLATEQLLILGFIPRTYS